ncbi:hypothetical protein [Megamonas funiformis]|uniref:gp53-like domain-containing protein n=1 Tax=Megamonas funiformis TaxID=437897 RepID=UPI0022E7DFB3|nr:hypothetical protein [Megamonas funiformis]
MFHSPHCSHNRQWGYFNQNSFSDKTYTVSFPIVFTNTLYIVTAIDKGKGDSSYSGGNGGNCIQSYTTTNFTYFSGFDANREGVLWFAIGK